MSVRPFHALPAPPGVAATLGALSAVAVLLVSGCSSSGPGANSAAATNPSVTVASGATATPGLTGNGSGASATGSSAAASSGGPAAPVGGPAVDINNFMFTPPSLTVPVGATVTWTNKDGEPHTVVANDGSFHSPGMDSNATFTYTFTKAGSFDYVCSIHPFMHGTVVVQ